MAGMHRSLLAAVALAACASQPPPVVPRPPSPAIDPALAALVGSVGPELRAVARLDLAERTIGGQLAGLEEILGSVGGKSLAACHASLARLRVAIGEPLRIAGEIDGDIDTARLACVLGDRLGKLATSAGLVIRDRPGGLSVTRAALTGAPRPAIVARCEGPSCVAVEVGPRAHPVRFSIGFADRNTFRLSGIDPTRLLAAIAGLHDPTFAAVTLASDHGDLVGAIGRDADPAWAAVLKDKLLEAFKIPSSSMRPTLIEGDHIFAVKGALAGPIVAGDVVVHRFDDRTYVKRVIATGGQTIAETADGITVDGVALPIAVVDPAFHFGEDDPERHAHIEHVGALGRESIGKRSYLTLRTGPPRELKSWTVPPGHLFLLGDNRNNSNDSRYQGPVAEADVIGRAVGFWLAMKDGAPDWARMGTPIE